jgi:hypothetical protein
MQTQPKPKKINVELLRQVQNAIVKHAAHFNMGTWGYGAKKRHIMHDESSESECGTTACIAGFIVLLHDGKVGYGVAGRAAKLLGLDYDVWNDELNGNKLFHLSNWPTKFCRRYLQAKRNLTRARVAAERIEHFIQTNGAE